MRGHNLITMVKAFVNGKIWQWGRGSSSVAGPFAEWMTVSEGGRIAAVGSGAAPPANETEDLHGALVLPGLHDAHIHVSMLGRAPSGSICRAARRSTSSRRG